MSETEFNFLLIVTVTGFLVVSLYALWLRINLWYTERVIRQIAIVQSYRDLGDSSAGMGCAPILFLMGIALALLVLFFTTI